MKQNNERPEHAALLVQARERSGVSAEKTAIKLGMPYSTYRGAELGRFGPKLFEHLEEVFPNEAAAIVAAWEAWNGTKQGSSVLTAAPKITSESTDVEVSHWFGVVTPNGRTRKYTSIDDVTLTINGDKVKAKFTRLFPRAHDRGRRWSGRGDAEGNKELRILFKPSGKQYDSSGMLIFIRRYLERSRLAFYEGQEVRCVDTDGGGRVIDVRSCTLYPKDQVPSEHMPAFAALDLDNTLFNGWSIIKWANGPHSHGLTEIPKLRAALAELAQSYERPDGITHDEFAVEAGRAYQAFLKVNDPTGIRQSAAGFASDSVSQGWFFSFAAELVASLRRMLIAPVLITGAPHELAVELGTAIGIDEIHAYRADQNGDLHPGTAEGKAAIIRRLSERPADLPEQQPRTLQFAAGDEDSDELILRDAPARAASAALLERHPDLDADARAFKFSADTSADSIVEWMKQTLVDQTKRPKRSKSAP